MKYLNLYTIVLFIAIFACTANSYAKESDCDFVLIEKEVQVGLHKRTKYGLAKKVKANSILRGFISSSTTSQVEIIPPIYDEIEEIYGDFFALAINDKMGLANKDGEILFDVIYDSITELGDYLIILLKNRKTGIAKRNGEILLEPTCTYVPQFVGEFALVNSYFMDCTGRSTLFNKKGEIVLDVKHNIIGGGDTSGINHLGNNFYNFIHEKSWGLIDELGNIIISPDESNYSYIIHADLIPYRSSIPKKYIIKSFILGIPVVYKNASSIPRTVKWNNVDAISYIGNDLYLYFKDKKFGIINRKREIIKNFKYDKMSIIDNTHLLLENSKDKDDSFKMETSEITSLKYILKNVEI